MAQQVRGAFAAVFGSSATKLGLHQVYDVSTAQREPPSSPGNVFCLTRRPAI